ncbi:MAG: HPP family protein [Betaproteobacteria bacterium]|nr:HPP family protein [Betaproteobacteria bacterium]
MLETAAERPQFRNPGTWLGAFGPQALHASSRERVLGVVGAMCGLLLSAFISHALLGGVQPWFVAPMGASAVLLFAVPSSPLAQPWSILGGNLIAALVGVAVARWIPQPMLAGALAGALAIALMFALRCLHPPSGAVALTAVLGGPEVSHLGWHFVLEPVMLNSVLLLLVALLFNNALGRRYPHRPAVPAHATADPPPSQRVGVSRDDLSQALREHAQVLDVDEDDVLELVQTAQRHAFERLHKSIDASDIMSRDVVRVGPETGIERARMLLERHAIKALPVVDEQGVLRGIVSLHDMLMRGAGATTVGQIMTREVLTTRRTCPVAELVAWFADYGLHHLPVVDNAGHVLGMITQSDLIAALYATGFSAAPAR